MFRYSFLSSILISSSLSAMASDIDELVVVGAGLSGLRVAQKMPNAQVYEARDRVGGRTFTQTINGVPVDLGAEFVDRDHKAMWDILKEFGLKTKGHNLSHKVMAVKDGEELSLSQMHSILGSLHTKLSEVAKIDTSSNSVDPSSSLYDQVALTEDEQFVLNLIVLDHEGIEGNRLPISYAEELAEMIDGYKKVTHAKQYSFLNAGLSFYSEQYRIVGGTKSLVDKLVEEVGKERIHLSMPLTKVSWDSGEKLFTLRFESGAERKARSVVMTTPFSVLQNNGILDDASLGISPEFRSYIDSRVYATSAKIVYSTTSPVNLCYGLDGQDGVCAWAKGDHTLSVILGGEKGRDVQPNSKLGQHFIQRLGTQQRAGMDPVVKNWFQEPYSKGSYSTMTTETPWTWNDTQSETSPELSRFATSLYAQGIPLLFAGESTVYGERGYMNSAIRSANAVAEILKKSRN